MVALDFSEDSQKAFDLAVKLIKGTSGEHVLYLATIIEKWGGLLATVLVDCDTQIIDSANRHLSKHSREAMKTYESRLQTENINYKVVFSEGDPRKAICNLCHEHDIDTLIVGRRGLSKLKSLVAGRVSSYAVEHAPCNVLIAH